MKNAVLNNKQNAQVSKVVRLRRQAGMSMVEISLVLIIALGGVAAAVAYFASNNTGSQANQLATDMSMLVGKVKSAYQGQYGQVTNARLNTGGFFAGYPALTNNAGVVTTALGGGTLTVSPGTVTAANDSVRYVITQFPDAACQPFVAALARTATTLSVGANVVKAAGGLPDPSRITCAGDNNTITMQVQ
ncbi:type 4 pilus major pilin [Massilia sp. LjRoot122]|uniref:type 4 pilus major pilin n=1 Tax=Massilia sp. LjRoot122 TaxID=3342257 RepID=UPI003ED09BD3